jgi:hypothetical protein
LPLAISVGKKEVAMIYAVVVLGLLAILGFARASYWKQRLYDEQEKLDPLFQEALEKSRQTLEANKELAGYKETCLQLAHRPVVAMMSNDQMQQLAHVIMAGLKPKEWIN